MNFLIILLISFIVVILLQFITNNLAASYLNKLVDLQIKQPQLLIKKLNSPISKLLIPLYQRYLLTMDAYSSLNDFTSLEATFKKIDDTYNKKLNPILPREMLLLLQKELNYYLYIKNKEKSKEVYTKIKAIKINPKDTFSVKLQQESNYYYQVYSLNNYSLIDDFKDIIEHDTNKINQGMAAYRLAYLYYKKGNNDQVNKYLQTSSSYLKDTDFAPMINKVIEDNSLLDIVMM